LSGPFFDPEVMGAIINEIAERSEVLLQGRCTCRVSAADGDDLAAALAYHGVRVLWPRFEIRACADLPPP
jgi:hypothetical protein